MPKFNNLKIKNNHIINNKIQKFLKNYPKKWKINYWKFLKNCPVKKIKKNKDQIFLNKLTKMAMVI